MLIPAENLKHPLLNEWSFWLFTNTKKVWDENLVELTSFNTVEDYWCLYHHMKLPSELSMGQDYAIFKKGITPMWEHERNKRGGRWQIMFNELKFKTLDNVWLDTVLLAIGENFLNSDLICGVVVNVRQKSKISIWTDRGNDSKAVMDIGRKLRKHLNVPNKLRYYLHTTSNSLYIM
ncbi:eukaryotic translation initiation factor 4E1-like [Anticarsia gemmatalis]|uniref:eukaryotic translation initiation factor 4E1-like n=1 Tax=Anticarsia gemmatalis TaxID=129554 RepID=UPI003F75F2A5